MATRNIEIEKTYYLYDTRAQFDVCKAHILAVLPHPTDSDDRVIVYRWWGRRHRCWLYGATELSEQQIFEEYVQKNVKKRIKKQSK